MIVPDVRFVQVVESIFPPGFIGSNTGDFLPVWDEVFPVFEL